MQLKSIVSGWTIFLLLTGACQAAPLQDFSRGSTAVAIEWRPNVEMRHTPVDTVPTAVELGLTHGIGDKTALEFRHSSYDSFYKTRDTSRNNELNLLYKYNDNIQFYSGYSSTSVREAGSSRRLENTSWQFGLIALKPLTAKTTVYAVVGVGNHLTNIEAGWSYLLGPGLELDATYRHLSVEKLGGENVKAHLRGFGLGVTYKF